MSTENSTAWLHELHGSEFEIASGQPAIRHWDVRDSSGLKIGRVADLIFDSVALKVRYIVLDVNHVEELDLEKRAVLVPIGLAKLDTKNEDVFFPTVTPFQLRALPRYDKAALGIKAEWGISQVFGREYTGSGVTEASIYPARDFYDHEHFSEAGLYGQAYINDSEPVSAEQLRQERKYGLDLARIRQIEREQDAIREGIDLRPSTSRKPEVYVRT